MNKIIPSKLSSKVLTTLQDNKRKKEHKKKTYHSPDGTHGSFADVKRARENVPTKMVSPLSHDREDKREHLHASIKKRMKKLPKK